MSTVVSPVLNKKITQFGKSDWNECYHCGNCTAVCSLTEDGNLFPRNVIRQLQMGLKNKFKGNVDPWLCYYCGDCSETCPRDANPGEMMMSARRYLTSIYDWTGLSGLLFKSVPAMIIGFILVAALIVGIGFAKQFSLEPIMEFGHIFEKMLIFGVVILILIPNIIRMFYFTVLKEKVKAPFLSYVKGIWDLFLHMFTQKKSLDCDKNTFRWFEHFLVVIGYILLLITTVFLNWFSTENPYIIWFGYVVGGLVFIFTFDFIIGRIRKNKEINKFSHPSDWLFVIWLFLMGLTAFIVRVLIDTNAIDNNLWMYMVHLIVIAQWGILIVPFGKWTHFLYRSFAVYFANLKRYNK